MEVDLNGTKAKVTLIQAKAASGLWDKEDHLNVWLEPEKPIANSIAFGITLPIKKYTKEELQKAIQEEGSRRALEMIKEEEESQATRRRINQKTKELADITSKLNKLL